MNRPTIFTSDTCPECEALKTWLKLHNIHANEIDADDIGKHQDRNEIMTQLATQDMALPVVWWQGEAMDGMRFRMMAVREDAQG